MSRYILEGDDVEKLIRAHLGLLDSDQIRFRHRPGARGPSVTIQREDSEKKPSKNRKFSGGLGLEAVVEHVHQEASQEATEGRFDIVSFSRSMSIRSALRELERAASRLHKLTEGGDTDAEQIAFIDLQKSLDALKEAHGLEAKAAG